jgi:Flp pilus assembly protein TadD
MFYSNWHEYVYHGTAGFYNSLGDLYQVMDKRAFAEAYYQQGRSYGFQNHHSNYVLGRMEAERNNLEQAQYHYELASAKRPTEYSLINNSNIYLTEDRVFNGIFSLKKALNTFPDSGPIQNNLGYAYAKIHLLDSALLLFEVARKHSVSKETAELNFTAFLAQEYMPVKADSITEWLSASSPAVASNALIIATTQNQFFKTSIDPLAAHQLNLYQATFLNNYIVNYVKEIDTTFIHSAYEIASDSSNEIFSEALKVSLAHAYYHKNNVNKALQILAELAYLSQSRQGKYNYIMGLWALEQGNVHRALQSFEYAVEYDYKDAKLYSAIALAEAHRIPEAITAVDSLLASKNENDAEIGRQLRKCLTISFSEVMQQPDLERYQFLRYRVGARDSILFNRIVDSFKDTNYKAQALLEMTERQFNNGNTPAAIRYFTRLKGLKLTDRSLFERMQHVELELLASRGELRLLATKINEGIEFKPSRNLEKLLYTALLSEANGDTATAETNYKILAVYNPFYEEGIIAAARYFK